MQSPGRGGWCVLQTIGLVIRITSIALTAKCDTHAIVNVDSLVTAEPSDTTIPSYLISAKLQVHTFGQIQPLGFTPEPDWNITWVPIRTFANRLMPAVSLCYFPASKETLRIGVGATALWFEHGVAEGEDKSNSAWEYYQGIDGSVLLLSGLLRYSAEAFVLEGALSTGMGVVYQTISRYQRAGLFFRPEPPSSTKSLVPVGRLSISVAFLVSKGIELGIGSDLTYLSSVNSAAHYTLKPQSQKASQLTVGTGLCFSLVYPLAWSSK
jgi:hypothetical protein